MARSECVYPRSWEIISSDSCAPFKEDGSDCSIFAFDVTADKTHLPLARNAVRKMRTLRHPGVIKVYDTVEVKQSYQAGDSLGHSLIHVIDRDLHLRCYGKSQSFGLVSKA